MSVVKKLISLDISVAKELEAVSKILNKSQKEVVENALDFYFDYTDGMVADKITQKIRDKSMKVYDSGKIYDKLGIKIEN